MRDHVRRREFGVGIRLCARCTAACVHVWDGSTDSTVRRYERDATGQPEGEAGWIEWARAESRRGNDAGAAWLLDRYRTRFGETDA